MPFDGGADAGDLSVAKFDANFGGVEKPVLSEVGRRADAGEGFVGDFDDLSRPVGDTREILKAMALDRNVFLAHIVDSSGGSFVHGGQSSRPADVFRITVRKTKRGFAGSENDRGAVVEHALDPFVAAM